MVRRRFERPAILSDLSLTEKGVLVVAIPVFALLLAMAAIYQLQRDSTQAAGWVTHTFEVRADIRAVMAQLVNAETATRGYLLTHQNSFLQPYITAQTTLPKDFENLSRLMTDNPGQQRRLSQIKSLADEAMTS